jgi:anti-sigma28 factor (negative regulator of flagellin synthesis)
MSINKVNTNNGIQAYNKLNVEQQSKVQSEKIAQNQVNDKKVIDNSSSKVSLSAEAVQKQQTEIKTEQVNQTKNVESTDRQARLDEISQQIKTNTYKVNPEAIANKMLQDKNLTNYILGM